MAIITADFDPEEKVSFYPKEMEELFEFIEP